MSKELQALNRQIRKHGSSCRAFYRGSGNGVEFVAIVSDFLHKRSVLSMRRFENIGRVLGVDAPNAIQLYTEYREFWDREDDIRVLYKGKSYDLVYSSIVPIDDRPAYVMAILEPVAAAHDDDEPIGGDDNG